MARLRNLLLFALPFGAAIAFLVSAVQGGRTPAQSAEAAMALPVRVMTLQAGAVTPSVTGHATVEPALTWRAVVEVPGRIVRLAPRLRQGAILPAGAELARIDEVDYRVALDRAEASLVAARAERAEAEADGVNLRATLALERETLALQEADTERQRELIRSGTTSRTTLNAAERTLLAQRVRVEDLEGSLRRLPARIDRLTALVAVAEADVAEAAEDLMRTRIALPVEARVASVEVEAGEYVAANTTLATLDGIARAEIVARLSEGAFQRFASLAGLDGRTDALPGVTAEVSAVIGAERTTWPAEVLRTTDAVAGDSRTIGVVVAVDDPLGRRAETPRPPLRKGAFVDVTLSAAPVERRLAVPLGALRDGRLYLADAGDRLRIERVEVALRQGEWAVLAPGALRSGDRVVLDDVVPAVAGRPLAPVEDPSVARPGVASLADAGGDAP